MNILVITAGLTTKKSFISDAFKDIYDADIIHGKRYCERCIDRLTYVFGMGRIARNETLLNDTILSYAGAKRYDVICIIKGLSVRKSTLDTIKANNANCHIVCWTCDDLFLPHNQTHCSLTSAPSYDVIFTTKSLNIKNKELQQIGFNRVEFVYQAYSKGDHYPIKKDSSEFKDKVLFIGYSENKRFEYINYLAKKGIIVDVYGNGWSKNAYIKRKHENVILHQKVLLGRDYAEAISNSSINLCFLREMNRDLHTSRTFEIPACGGFMLAERTHEHEHLFKEGEEVEFFDSKDELLGKVRYYLANPEQRNSIAQRGYQRARNDTYSYHHMVDLMMSKIFEVEA